MLGYPIKSVFIILMLSTFSNLNVNAMQQANVCRVCSQEGKFACSKCKNAFYCGSEHQKSDWGTHKLECKPKVNLAPTELNKSAFTALFEVEEMDDLTKELTTSLLEDMIKPDEEVSRNGNQKESFEKLLKSISCVDYVIFKLMGLVQMVSAKRLGINIGPENKAIGFF